MVEFGIGIGNHTNLISSFYVDNIRGIDTFYQNQLIQFIKKGITAPKRIHKDLTEEFGILVRVNVNAQVVNTQNGLSDLIPLRSKKQIKSFIDRNKDHYSIEYSTNLDHNSAKMFFFS